MAISSAVSHLRSESFHVDLFATLVQLKAFLWSKGGNVFMLSKCICAAISCLAICYQLPLTSECYHFPLLQLVLVAHLEYPNVSVCNYRWIVYAKVLQFPILLFATTFHPCVPSCLKVILCNSLLHFVLERLAVFKFLECQSLTVDVLGHFKYTG